MACLNSKEMFPSEEDPKVMEFDILFRSTLEFSDENSPVAFSSSEEDYGHPRGPPQLLQQEVEEEKKTKKCEGGVSSSSFCSSSNEGGEDNQEEVISKMEGATARTRTFGGGGGGEVEVKEKDDGFRTPTSLDHRIQVIQQCPPAPRKPKSLPIKRKASSSSSSASRRQLFLLDLSKEIESLFPLALQADLGRKIKKVRRGDDDTN